MSIDFQDDVTDDELLLAQSNKIPTEIGAWNHGFVERVVLNTKEAALNDGFMPTSLCELKATRNQIRS